MRYGWTGGGVIPKEQLNYIMGNPPFVGARLMSSEQKKDVTNIFSGVKGAGNIDYVGCWYLKAKNLMKNTDIKTALVSTNSITQGEQTAILWKPLINDGIKINFAYKTFRWDSEATLKAHVHCVIIGFSFMESKNKVIFLNNKQKVLANNINPYLIDGPNLFVESRSKPICNVSKIGIGNKPIDGGFYLFKENEKNDFIKSEPSSERYFRKWIGADEFIKGNCRYCLWLGDCSPAEIKKMPECHKRVEAVRNYRLNSISEGTRKIANKPTRFHVENMPFTNYIIIPRVSSEKRRYIPIGFLTSDILASDSVHIIPEATIFDFGILTSKVHNAWMRVVCGRLKSDYRYSKDIVYNNFPWPEPTEEQKKKISETAQNILDVRASFPDCSLADLYDETLMPPVLYEAHKKNDKAVMQAYGFSTKMPDSECVAELFKLYEKLTQKD